MKLAYYPETDSLYIEFSEKMSVESTKISEDIVLDYDNEGKILGINIDNASLKAKLKELIINRLPSEIKKDGITKHSNGRQKTPPLNFSVMP